MTGIKRRHTGVRHSFVLFVKTERGWIHLDPWYGAHPHLMCKEYVPSACGEVIEIPDQTAFVEAALRYLEAKESKEGLDEAHRAFESCRPELRELLKVRAVT